MSIIEIFPMQQSSVLYTFSLRDEITADQDYQRQSDIWPLSKKQLLIDTLLNGYDLPKLYFHEFKPPRRVDGRLVHYAVVDGKQRLQAIWEFIEGKFALAENFVYLQDPDLTLARMSYGDLAKKFPKIKMRFDSLSLPIFTIRTDEEDLIEDMFTRLNEGAPLNAAEKRNTLGGPIPKVIRRLAEHVFFKDCVSFSNKRYRHYDTICKLLLLEYVGAVTDTKKIHLDRFVKSFDDQGEAARLEASVAQTLDGLSVIFDRNDPLLRSIGMVPVYFLLHNVVRALDMPIRISREEVISFEEKRALNRELVQSDEYASGVDFDLLEYDRLAQTPNDSYAIKFRLEILARNVLPERVRDAAKSLIAAY